MQSETVRSTLLRHVAHRCLALQRERTIVAVDGIDGSGKTVFADELAGVIQGGGRHVVRASIDGFHHPREHRYRRGREDPEGYFLDSYDYDALFRGLLQPFWSGEPEIRTAVFDHRSDHTVMGAEEMVPTRSTLLIDGIFLHRNELAGCWDLSAFLDVPFAVSYRRMAARDGCDPDPFAAANRRYLEGQGIYLQRCRPHKRATVVIDNADLEAPRLLRAARPDAG